MKFFIDTANILEIEQAASLGIIAGVTTNPSLIAKEKRDFKAVVREIAQLVEGPISTEVVSVNHADMLSEARELANIAQNIVIKVPMNKAGLMTVKALKAEGIKTNVTLVFSANQALLAARAGAAYVSPFVGRLDDISQDGIPYKGHNRHFCNSWHRNRSNCGEHQASDACYSGCIGWSAYCYSAV